MKTNLRDMQPISVGEMRSIEQKAMESGAATGLELMERAGQGVVEAIQEEWPDMAAGPARAVVFCGPGNNGGDGYVIARLLAERGWTVRVLAYGNPEKLPTDARDNFLRYSKTGDVEPLENWKPNEGWGADLIIDALFGTGLSRPLEDLTSLLFNIDDAADLNDDPDTDITRFDAPKVVAVDIPSGLNADTGEVRTPSHRGHGAASANLTVTFHRPKHGHLLGMGPELCGSLVVKDIGL